MPVYVPQQHEPWATIYTKRPTAVDLTLTGPKGRFALGRIPNWAPIASLTGRTARHAAVALPSAEDLARRFAPVTDRDLPSLPGQPHTTPWHA